jgi:hypothetical protein
MRLLSRGARPCGSCAEGSGVQPGDRTLSDDSFDPQQEPPSGDGLVEDAHLGVGDGAEVGGENQGLLSAMWEVVSAAFDEAPAGIGPAPSEEDSEPSSDSRLALASTDADIDAERPSTDPPSDDADAEETLRRLQALTSMTPQEINAAFDEAATSGEAAELPGASLPPADQREGTQPAPEASQEAASALQEEIKEEKFLEDVAEISFDQTMGTIENFNP